LLFGVILINILRFSAIDSSKLTFPSGLEVSNLTI